MILEFHEQFDLRVEDIYPFFPTPRDWTRLYGAFGEVEDRGDGWYAVPLRRFPFPLVVRITRDEPMKRVSWEFKGFWRGEGEVTFTPKDGGAIVEGSERISVRPLRSLSPLVERLFLEKRFKAVWDSGWRRLRRQAANAEPHRVAAR